MGHDAVDNQHQVGGDKAEKDGQQDLDGFFQAAQIHDNEHGNEEGFGPYLVRLETERQEGRERVHPGRDRDGDREHIVEHEGAAGNQAQVGADQFGGDAVTASTGGKQFDHLVVGQRNDEHRHRGGDGHVQAQVGMDAQRAEGFFRAVGGGGQAVRAQADPGQEGHQRHRVARFRFQRVERLA